MLTPYLSLALAIAGTVLMAVVIFAPVPLPATVTVSFAPPVTRPHELPFTEAWPGVAPFDPDEHARGAPERVAVAPPRWPELVDPSAAECDAATRLALVEALRSVRAPWAEQILRQALDEEHDGTVREAIRLAIGASSYKHIFVHVDEPDTPAAAAERVLGAMAGANVNAG